MKFRTTIEIDITDDSKPSEQDVQDLIAKIIGYGSLNIKQNAQHIPIKQASFNITRTEKISDRFYNLPIITHEPERKPDGWTRFIKVQKTVKDILDTWDINDKNDMSEMTQVLRHLKNACEIIDTITQGEAK